jgi:hypothetical protein
MTWTLWLALGSFCASILAAFFAWAAWRSAVRDCVSSVSVQKLAWIESELLDTRDLIAGLDHSIRKLRSRMYVRKRRDEAEEAESLPADRDAVKRALRAKVGIGIVTNRRG